MKVEDLIEMLKKGCDPQDEVKIFDPETMGWESVTGMVYGDDDGVVQLYSDNP
jgi:hypothetical protein